MTFTDLDPPVPKYQTSDPASFGYPSTRERTPTILTGVIDDVHRAIAKLTDDQAEKVSEGKKIISELAGLKYEMQHNRSLTPLVPDGSLDIQLYNDELTARGGDIRWHETEWLFSECYMYRRTANIFAVAKHWKHYDYFRQQKISTFKSSRPAVLELASHYRSIISKLRDTQKVAAVDDAAAERAAEKVLFIEMAEVCLWGNATDLSLLTTLTYEDIQKLQGSNARKASEKNILVNDLDKVFDILNKAKTDGKSSRRVDFVLDNAGFELFVDLILAGYLLATGLATEVVLHPKSVPWFVSDVIPADFSDLLNAMYDPKNFYEAAEDDDHGQQPLSPDEADDVKFLFDDWSRLHGEGQLLLRPNHFWTHGGSFWRMPRMAPELFHDLQNSDIVVFKGDLNYRKLCGDAAWDPTTPFAEAIGPLGRTSNLRILALRTCKSDVVVGLPQGKDEELRAMPGGSDGPARKWAWTGKWAVIEFNDGKM